MLRYKMWIGGKFVNADSGQTFTTRNPATGEEISEVPLAAKSDVDKAVAAAHKAFPIWSRMAQGDRSDIIVKIGEIVRKHIRELVRLETMEHGSPSWLAEQMLKFAAGNIEYAAAIARNHMGQVLPPFLNMGEPGQKEPNTCGVSQIRADRCLRSGNSLECTFADDSLQIGAVFGGRQHLRHQTAEHQFHDWLEVGGNISRD